MLAGSSRADRLRRPSLPAPCLLALPSNKEPRPLTLDPANKRELGRSPAAVGPTASSVIFRAPMLAGSSRADRSRRPSSGRHGKLVPRVPRARPDPVGDAGAARATLSPARAMCSARAAAAAGALLDLAGAAVPRGRCSKCECEAPSAALVRCLAEPSPPAPRGRQSTPPAPPVAWARRSTPSSSSARSLALRLPAKGRGPWPLTLADAGLAPAASVGVRPRLGLRHWRRRRPRRCASIFRFSPLCLSVVR